MRPLFTLLLLTAIALPTPARAVSELLRHLVRAIRTKHEPLVRLLESMEGRPELSTLQVAAVLELSPKTLAFLTDQSERHRHFALPVRPE